MANDHPFQTLFETLGRIPTSHAESVNRQAYEILSDMLTVPVEKAGRCILLRAPRAGHGKTHLLSRVQHQLGSTHEFIPLHPAFGCRVDATSVMDDALRRLVRPLPASGGLCVLDLVTRRLFALALQPLVASGEVPCQDREGALTALRMRPIETFDFHHPNAVTAHWARENFEVLGQRLSLELAQRCTLPVREICFWVDALFRFAATPVENSGRVRALAESVHASNAAEGEPMERMEALLGLLSQLMRVVLVADDLEGFSADETAALRLAAFLGSLRQSVERLDVILSLNLDIWQSAFVPRLSGGLADRLSEVVIELEPLTETEMIALLDSRVPGLGSRVLAKIDVNAAGTHARGLIRAAGMAWLKATAMDSALPPDPPVLGSAPPPSPVAAAAPVIADRVEPTSQAAVIEPTALLPEPEVAPEMPLAQQAPAPSPFAAMADTTPVFESNPAAEISPVNDNLPPVSEAPMSWPAAEFHPVEPSESAAVPVVETSAAPFQISTPEAAFVPVASGYTPAEWESSPQAYAEEIAPVAQFDPEPVTSWQQPAESPFRDTTSPEQGNPPPAQYFQPAQDFIPPQPSQHYHPSQLESPFQFSPTTSTPEPQPANFTPAPWPETSPNAPEAPAAFQPQIDSPFQIAQPTPEAFPQSQNYQSVVPAPAPAFQVSPEPAFSSPVQAVDPTPADTDRVDDLLRQFRERYGRGSL